MKHRNKKAVALKYKRGENEVPKVVAKGRGELAEKIIDVAEEYKIPLIENIDLAEVLDALDVDMEIPPALYRAVAEVLAFVYQVNEYGVKK